MIHFHRLRKFVILQCNATTYDRIPYGTQFTIIKIEQKFSSNNFLVWFKHDGREYFTLFSAKEILNKQNRNWLLI